MHILQNQTSIKLFIGIFNRAISTLRDQAFTPHLRH
jgi:hypothetical protein